MPNASWLTALLIATAGCDGDGNGVSNPTSTPPATIDAGTTNAHDAGAPADAAMASGAPDAAPPHDAAMPGDAAAPLGGSDGGAPDGGSDGGAPACTTTTPVTIVSGLHSAGSLQVDDQYVYYLDVGPFAVSRVPKSGGTPTMIFDFGGLNDDVYAEDYVVDANFIYVMRYGHAGMNLAPGSIQYFDKSATFLRDVPAGEANPSCDTPLLLHLAAADGIVFYVQEEGTRTAGCAPLPNEIVRLAPGDSVGTIVASAGGAGQVSALAATHDAVYWADSAGVERLANGGATTQLVAAVTPPSILVSDGSAIYWSDGSTLERSDGAGTTALTTQPLYPQADDGHTLYGLTAYDDSSAPIVHIGNDGSGYTTTTTTSSAVTIDAQYLYFSNGTSIQRVCR